MKKAMLKVLSLAMALTLVASLAACGGNSEEETTTGAADTTAEDVVTPENPDAEAPSEDASAEETEVVTEIVTDKEGHTQIVTEKVTKAPAKPGEPTKAPAGGDNKPSAPAEKTSLNGQEALDLFNKATVGKSKKGVRTTDVALNKLPGSLDNIKGTLANMIAKSAKPADITKFANTNLTMADVSSATATKNGNNWNVSIKIKNGTAPSAHAFEELPKAEIDKWLVGTLNVQPYENVKFNYANGTINATIDANGNVVNATYVMKVTLDIQNVKAKLGPIPFSVDAANVSVTQTDKF